MIYQGSSIQLYVPDQMEAEVVRTENTAEITVEYHYTEQSLN